MLKLRLLERYGVRAFLCGEGLEGYRELGPRVGHPGGPIDWERTAASCRVVNGECIEIDLVCREEAGEEGGEDVSHPGVTDGLALR